MYYLYVLFDPLLVIFFLFDCKMTFSIRAYDFRFRILGKILHLKRIGANIQNIDFAVFFYISR